MNRQDYVLEMLEVSKGFPGVQALDKVTLRVKKGEVHALMGENGAGKSTLMKILDGIYKPDSGTIRLRGEQVSIRNPHDAIQKGIAMIHQELNPVPAMTIAENIFLGRECHRHGFVDKKRMLRETGELLTQMGFDLDPAAQMDSLSISGCQLVEIAKAVSYHADVIIMDEPSSAITENEVAKLFQIIRNLTAEGVSVIYITHKMDEVFQIADSATVIRDGHYIDSRPIGEFTPETLVNMLVGRELKAVYPKETVPIGDVLLEASGLTRKKQYENVSFTLRRGEILGVAGLVGAGRTEVFESVAGLTRPDSGEIRMNGNRLDIRSPRDAIRSHIVIATEDRKGTGLCLGLKIRDNIMAEVYTDRFPNGFVSEKAVAETCNAEMGKFNIKAPSINQKVGNLSGGNQQKVVLSKVLLTDPEVVIFDEPTRGIDVGAKSEIYKIMVDLARAGKGVVMISSELPEILGMSDRIMVMCHGQVAGFLDSGVSQEEVFRMACGQTGQEGGESFGK